MLSGSLQQNQFLLGYGQMLVSDIDDLRMTEQPLPGVNHPAWILGHLALTADRVCSLVGAEKRLAEEWGKLFGAGSQVTANRSSYPSKDELLRGLEERFRDARRAVEQAPLDTLAVTNPNERLRGMLPRVEDLIGFLMTGHVGVHLGQLSAWRRMLGLPPLF